MVYEDKEMVNKLIIMNRRETIPVAHSFPGAKKRKKKKKKKKITKKTKIGFNRLPPSWMRLRRRRPPAAACRRCRGYRPPPHRRRRPRRDPGPTSPCGRCDRRGPEGLRGRTRRRGGR